MSEWRRVKLGDLVTIRTGKKDANFGSPDGEYPFFTCARQVSRCRSYSFDCDAILLAGNCDISNMQRYCGKFEAYQRTYVLTNKDDNVSDLDYIWNCLRLDWVRVTMGKMLGAAIKYIKLGMIKEFELELPPLPIQRRIADYLSAYDDLIENNRRRIEILEETARTLYRKMFVVEAKPEWKKCYLSDVVDICSGGTPSTKNDEYWNGGVPFFGPSDVTNFAYVYDTEKNISEVGLKARRLTLFPKDTVFITARGTVGKVNLIQRPMAMNQSCFALIAKNPISQFFLYYALATKGPSQFRCVAKGSVFEAIGTAEFACIPFVVPAKRLIDEFTNTVDPMLQQMAMLSRQNAKLAAARDLLLPRLMSGKMEV